MANQTEVRVELRSISLSPSAELAELPDGSFFVALDEPPPVRTVLSVREKDGEPRAFEVCHVVEIGEAGPTGARGCQGRFVEAERLEQQHGVGSGHLAPGEPHSSPDAAGSDDGVPERIDSTPPEVQAPYDAASTSEATEASREEPPAEAGTPSDAASTSEATGAPGEELPAAAETDEPTSEPAVTTSSGGKKRKGRKRR